MRRRLATRTTLRAKKEQLSHSPRNIWWVSSRNTSSGTRPWAWHQISDQMDREGLHPRVMQISEGANITLANLQGSLYPVRPRAMLDTNQ